ncbi:MAG: hypothetical protein DRP65_11445 [Planctomycetota bacterium]|nr:MAG: hypothetical protein DRP65_11445 [Planctomycetota bacterium]
MKIWEPKNSAELKALMTHLCGCHDASITRISFIKDRTFDEDGNLVYPFGDTNEFVNCNVEMELLLNCYPGAKKQQVVVFKFIDTRIFVFMQDESFDYSNIFKVDGNIGDDSQFNFIFYSSRLYTSKRNDKVKSLELSCAKVICTEL